MSFIWKGRQIKWMGEPIIVNDPLTISELKTLQETPKEAYMLHFEFCQEDVNKEDLCTAPKELLPIIEQFSDLFQDPLNFHQREARTTIFTFRMALNQFQ